MMSISETGNSIWVRFGSIGGRFGDDLGAVRCTVDSGSIWGGCEDELGPLAARGEPGSVTAFRPSPIRAAPPKPPADRARGNRHDHAKDALPALHRDRQHQEGGRRDGPDKDPGHRPEPSATNPGQLPRAAEPLLSCRCQLLHIYTQIRLHARTQTHRYTDAPVHMHESTNICTSMWKHK